MPAAQRRAWVGRDCLKINSAYMKTTELKNIILKAVAENDHAALAPAEARFLATVHDAALAYEDEVRLGHPAPERRCTICREPINHCQC